MNRNLTLILSALIVVILLVIWVYLTFFASNEPSVIEETGTFTEFDSLTGDELPGGVGSGGGDVTGSNSNGLEQDENGEIIWPILRQLTTRNVIGYQEVVQASSTQILFMESGVGHIYRIDLSTGEEERISVTTIPDARQAEFSSDGQYVVVKTGDDVGINPISRGEIDYENNTVTVSPVAEQVSDYTVTDDGYILYGSVTNNSVVVTAVKLADDSSSVLFRTPFREAALLFGKNQNDTHYFMPKTSFLLEGFVYEVVGSNLTRLNLDGFGFSFQNLDSNLIATYRDRNNLVTDVYDVATGDTNRTDMPLIPEKCVSSFSNVYCAVPGNKQLQYNSPDRWLQGVDAFYDNLWQVGETFEQLIDITAFSGRNVDVVNTKIGNSSADWYFQNKLDNSLWIYELSRLTSEVESEEEDENDL